MKLFSKCRLAYRYQYVDKEPTEEPLVMALGRMIHAGLDAAVFWLVTTDLRFPMQLLPPELLEALTTAISDAAVESTCDELEMEHFDQAVAVVSTWITRNEVRPELVLSTEEFFSTTLDSDLGKFKLGGKIDRLNWTDASRLTLEIVDYKSGGRELDERQLREDTQMSSYAAGVVDNHPEAVGVVVTHDYVSSGNKVTVAPHPSLIGHTIGKLARFAFAIEEERDFHPNPGRHCSWCDHRNICPYEQAAPIFTYDDEPV